MDTLAGMRDEGRSIDELHDWIEQHKLDLNHWFFSTDLTFYIRGGRISKTAGTVGTILGICPLLNMDDEGRLIPRSKIRGKKKVIQEIVKRMEENAQDGLDYSGNQLYRNYHRKSYRTWHSCLVFLGQKAPGVG